MKEIRDIIKAFDMAVAAGKQTALATVVHVEGSSYRRPGARMLITEDGELTGAISGGCLEGDALRKALHVMARKEPMLVTYDTMDEDDAVLGAQLGCQGIIRVLIEPVNTSGEKHVIHLLKDLTSKREPAVLVTLFSLNDKNSKQAGTRLLLRKNETVTRESPALDDKFKSDARERLSIQRSCFRNYIGTDNSCSAFIEYIEPAVSLILAGAGNDVVPLVAMSQTLGWETTVVDGRPGLAKADRFASGCRVMLAKPESMIDQLSIDDRTFFVLMTHNYNYDKAMMRALLQRDVRYIGMLGPRKKLERMLDEFSKEGLKITESQLAGIHSPVGLDLGAETPEEIALSILSEVMAIISGRRGLSLHSNTGSIHARNELDFDEVMIKDQKFFLS